MICRSPDCRDSAVEGDKWCDFHGPLLRRVRAELEAGAQHRLRSGAIKKKLYDPIDDAYRDIREAKVI